MIYLDNSATTRIDDAVFDAMVPWLRDGYGNASSPYGPGRAARVAIEDARTELASYLNAHPAELIFTSGGTEANNTALKSMVHWGGVRTIVTSPTEHHAILHPCEVLAASGTAVSFLDVDERGVVQTDGLATFDARDTLVTIMHANNETGVLQPVEAVRGSMPEAFIHTDAVQSFGKVAVDVQALGVDLVSISAHKIHGPKGIGALFIRKGIDFQAHQQGGAQERNRRAGTEPTALIVGFQVAARLAITAMDERYRRMRRHTSMLRDILTRELPSLRVNTPVDGSLPNILNVSFMDADRLDGEAILQLLDLRGVCVSNGSACVSGSQQPSHVLAAMGLPDAEAKAAIRFSVGKDTTDDDIFSAAAITVDLIRNLRV